MTERDVVAERSTLVPGAHRLIRALDGKEGPFAGTLVTWHDGVAVCVDAETLAEWKGWGFSDAEHICGVMDVRRRADGHDALLPWCTQRVDSFLGRRQVADAMLTAGELGTLVVSLLRGIRELGPESEEMLGEWWLSGDGRPLFVHGEAMNGRTGTATLIERIAQHSGDRATVRLLEEIAAALRQPRHHVDDDRRWEQQLLAIAAPRALRMDVFAPERVADIVPRKVTRAAGRREINDLRRASSRKERAEPTSALRWGRSVLSAAREFAGGLRGRFTRAGGVVASGTAPRSRRKPLIVAASLAGLVLAVGLLWPTGEDPVDASAATPAAPDIAEQEPEVPVTEEPTPLATAPTSAAAVDSVSGLLMAIQTCVQAEAKQCASAVADGAPVPVEGIAALGPEASTATLVDDYGDVAVIRLTPVDTEAAHAEQMLVLERRNDIWLVRDVYDVAHQPE